MLTDVCPYTLGIETTSGDDLRRDYGMYLPIIERNSVVPVSRVKTVSTLDDNQTAVKLCIFQGESRLVKHNIYPGELEVPVPPRRAGEVRIEVRFTYDNNGLLEAEAHVPMTGARLSLVIENNPGVLSPEEIAQRLEALSALKRSAGEQRADGPAGAPVSRKPR